jgi:hypothetical protein
MYNFEDVNINGITIDLILKKISEIDIYSYYITSFRELGRVFKSELRKDNKPSCSITHYNGSYFYRDFSLGETINCWTYVMKKFNCNFQEALNIIATDFNVVKIRLKNAQGEFITQNDVRPILGEKVQQKSSNSVIEVFTRSWDIVDWEYFNSYCLDFDILERYEVIPLKFALIGSFRVDNKKSSPLYAYKFKDRYKIYRPNELDFKWFSNTKSCNIQGFKQLPETGGLLIIGKSLKDVMVYYRLGYNAIAPQSESSGIPENIIDELKSRFKKILINFDDDLTGVTFTHKLSEQFKLDYFFIKEDKDISDKMKRIGLIETKQYIDDKINEYTTNNTNS